MIRFRLLGVIMSRVESNINLIHMEAFCEELEALDQIRNFIRQFNEVKKELKRKALGMTI